MRRLGALLVLAAAARAEKPYEGTWRIEVDRPGWQPAIATGTLVLDAKGGNLAFDILLNGRRHGLTDFEAKGKKISFRLDTAEFDIRFTAEVAKESLAGRCVWKEGGDWAFTAKRKEMRPEERFEKGLSYQGYFPKGDGKYGGAALDELISAAAESDTDALLVLKDGKVVCERNFGRPPGPLHIMSVTKFVTALAVGFLLEEERIESVDVPLSTWFPDWAEGEKAEVTIRHLLTHTSGIEIRRDDRGRPNARVLNAEKDKVAFVRASRLTAKPGTEHAYSNEGAALLSGVIASAAGEEVEDYLTRRLFTPLKITEWSWDRDAADHTLTYANLQLSARDLARIGEMVAEGGRKILKPETIRLLGTPATPLSRTQGLLWQLRLDDAGKVVGYFHTGWLGQWLCIYPGRKLVGVRLRSFKNEADAERAEYEFGRFQALLEALP
jgi:CubicO group peptidase (beta-lactamase class C family)